MSRDITLQNIQFYFTQHTVTRIYFQLKNVAKNVLLNVKENICFFDNNNNNNNNKMKWNNKHNIYTYVDVAKLMLSSNSSEVEMALCNHKDTQYYLVCFGKQKNIKYNI